MKSTLSTLALLFAAFAAASTTAQTAPAPAAAEKPAPEKLIVQVEVPASLPAVWEAFSTSPGLSTWLGPNATVDLRPGGDWLVHFPGGSTGGGTIVSFVPQKQIVIAALAPDQFPHVRADRTRCVFEFEPDGKSTIVRLTQSGWKEGPEWQHAYEYLTAGNAQLMSMLYHRFVSGPIDWQKAFADSSDK